MRSVFLLLICCGSVIRAEPRLDPYGDPLPEGAISRLGSTRLHIDTLTWANLTPDGKRIVSGGMYGERRITVWEAATMKTLKTLPTKEVNETWGVAVSPDGKRAAAVVSSPGKAEFDMSAIVWETETGKRLGEFPLGHRNSGAERLVFSADGKRFAVVCNDLRLIEIETGKVLMQTPLPTRVRSLAFVDNERYVLGNHLPRLQLWDVATGKLVPWTGPEKPVTMEDQTMTPDGKFLFTVEPAKLTRYKVQLPTKPGEAAKLSDKRSITVSDVEKKGCWASRDGSQCVLHSANGDVEIVDFNRGKSTPSLNLKERTVFDLAFTDGGPLMLVRRAENQYDRTLEVIDLVKRKNLTHEVRLRYADGEANWLPDGKKIRTGWQLWDAANGNYLGTNSAYGEPKPPEWKALDDRKFAMSPDGKLALVAVGGGPMTPRLTPLANREIIEPISSVEVWDVASNQRLRTFRGRDSKLPPLYHFSGEHSLSFDGRIFAGCDLSLQSHIEIWDTTIGRMLMVIRNDSVGALRTWTISADGRRVLVAGTSAIAVLDVRSRKFETHISYPESRKDNLHSTLSLGGRLAAVTFSSGELIVFDLQRNKIAAQIKTEQSELWRVAFSPDSRQILTQGQGGWVHVWPSPKLPPLPSQWWENDYGTAWKALFAPNGAEVTEAMNRWSRSGLAAVEFIGKHVETPKGPDEKELAEKIDQLGAKEFRVRDAAQRELSKRGEPIVPLLQKRLTKERDAEIKERLQKIIENPIDPILPTPSPELLRSLRAVEILERIGLPAAKAQIQRLAKGADGDPLTMEAQSALRRMK